MGSILFFIASGLIYLIGLALVLLSVVVGIPSQRRWIRWTSDVLAVVGGVGIVFSPVPMPAKTGWILLLVIVAWLIIEHASSRRWLRHAAQAAVVAICVWLAVSELRWQLRPARPAGPFARLYIVGDSVTAGIGRESTTWPRILHNERKVEVVDLSRAGATAASALSNVQKTTLADGLVLLEIGGNDLLRRAPAASFERDLDQLIGQVSGPGREVAMFELPVLDEQAARIQRRLAAKLHLLLIPRRYLATLFTTDGNTLDGIHLSDQGHQAMATMVWELLGPSLSAEPEPHP